MCRTMLLLILLFSACTTKTKEASNDEKSNAEVVDASIKQEDFKEFYIKFNQDPVFQNSRISDESSRSLNGHLDVFHLDSSVFTVVTKREGNAIRERIINKSDTTYFIEYLFKVKNGKWFVMEYLDSYYN